FDARCVEAHLAPASGRTVPDGEAHHGRFWRRHGWPMTRDPAPFDYGTHPVQAADGARDQRLFPYPGRRWREAPDEGSGLSQSEPSPAGRAPTPELGREAEHPGHNLPRDLLESRDPQFVEDATEPFA